MSVRYQKANAQTVSDTVAFCIGMLTIATRPIATSVPLTTPAAKPPLPAPPVVSSSQPNMAPHTIQPQAADDPDLGQLVAVPALGVVEGA